MHKCWQSMLCACLNQQATNQLQHRRSHWSHTHRLNQRMVPLHSHNCKTGQGFETQPCSLSCRTACAKCKIPPRKQSVQNRMATRCCISCMALSRQGKQTKAQEKQHAGVLRSCGIVQAVRYGTAIRHPFETGRLSAQAVQGSPSAPCVRMPSDSLSDWRLLTAPGQQS